MINARVFYKKLGRAKYISALDVTRMAQRALKRADKEHGLKLWYTEGFNPHLYVSFALPLSLGYESEYEAMDIRLLDDNADLNEVCRIIDSVFPADMPVLRVAVQKDKPTAITSALYHIHYLDKSHSPQELCNLFNEYYNGESIMVSKKTKKGNKDVDIKPDCRLVSVEPITGGIFIKLITAAGTQKTVNPSLLSDGFTAYIKGDLNDNERFTTVMRKEVYTDKGTLFE